MGIGEDSKTRIRRRKKAAFVRFRLEEFECGKANVDPKQRFCSEPGDLSNARQLHDLLIEIDLRNLLGIDAGASFRGFPIISSLIRHCPTVRDKNG